MLCVLLMFVESKELESRTQNSDIIIRCVGSNEQADDTQGNLPGGSVAPKK